MAEQLHSPWMLHILEHTLRDKAATATQLHDSKTMWPWDIQAAFFHSGLGGFTSLCSLSSSSSLKFSFTYLYSHSQSLRVNRVFCYPQRMRCSDVLTASGHRDGAKPQLLPFASAETALCEETTRMNQIIGNLLRPCFKNIWQRVGLALNSVA